MMLYLLLCCTLFLPVLTSNVTLTKQEGNSNNLLGKPDDVNTNSKKLTFISEGGAVSAKTPELSLSMEKANKLLDLDAEIPMATNKSSVVARKGVTNTAQDVTITNDSKNASKKIDNTTNDGLPTTKSPSKSKIMDVSKSTSSEVPKKPLILSYEALANADKNIANEMKIPASNPSSKTQANSQIPSPNDGSIVKLYPKKADSHPDMIMPIVITILVVPMFAIVGYMALKRGKEAWKNRHYKRMDFLLDGMYND